MTHFTFHFEHLDISWFTNKQRLVWFFIVSSLAFFFVIFLYNLYEYVCGWSGVRESAQASYLGRNIVDTRHFFASTFVCKMMKVWHLFWKIYLTRFFKLLLKNYCSKTWKISLCMYSYDRLCMPVDFLFNWLFEEVKVWISFLNIPWTELIVDTQISFLFIFFFNFLSVRCYNPIVENFYV